MADFATSFFVNHPHATLVVCECERITAINIAAEELFRRPDIKQQIGAVQCGITCHSNPSIEDLGITIQGGVRCWPEVLKQSQKPAPKSLNDKHALSHNEFMIKFLRTALARTNLPQDSPMEDSFPQLSKDHRRHLADGQTSEFSDDVLEALRAKIDISSFSVEGKIQYMLAISEVVVAQYQETDEVEGSVKEENWLGRCRDALFDSLPRLGYICDVNGNSTRLNKYAETYYGAAIVDMEWYNRLGGVWDTTFTHKLDKEDFPAVRIVRTQKPLEPSDYGIFDPATGVKTVVRCWGFPLYDRLNADFLGSVVYLEILGTYANLMERKRRDSLRSFETICDSMPHFVWTADTNGSGDWFSSQWLSYTGLKLQDLKGWGWKNSIHPDDLPRFMKAFSEAHEKAASYEMEARCRRKDGVYRWMLKRGAPIKDDDGKVLRWVRRLYMNKQASLIFVQTGTNTEIHDAVIAKIGARTQRDQIVAAMSHCNVNVWAVNKTDKKLTMLEGAYMRGTQQGGLSIDPNTLVWDDVSNRDELEKAVADVLEGTRPDAEVECKIEGQWNKVSIFQDVLIRHTDMPRFA